MIVIDSDCGSIGKRGSTLQWVFLASWPQAKDDYGEPKTARFGTVRPTDLILLNVKCQATEREPGSG